MVYTVVDYKLDAGVATITLNRPDVLNSMNGQMRAEILDAVRTAGAEARIALAGPAATGLAAGVFWLLATLTAPADQPALAPTMFDWPSRMNT